MKIDSLMRMGITAYNMIQDEKVQSVIKFLQNRRIRKKTPRNRMQGAIMNSRVTPRMHNGSRSPMYEIPQRHGYR
ncbi:hypothetical protein GCM10025859_30420 [Alicyclobacillus fastidiosus]|nr:hypothetical protein GCM10025859_30420 [Alicyclobacillus fastidiosus]